MKKKNKKKRSPRIARPPPAKSPLVAHPRLVHGFLVRQPTRSASPGGRSGKPEPPVRVASVKAPAQRPVVAEHEGPAGDETFH